MKTAFVFPGQGSQAIGMGKDLHDNFLSARAVFQEIDETLKQNLSHLMFFGDSDALNLTENTQPALMAVSMAVMAILRKEGNYPFTGKVAAVAGHSLGEYSAHAAVQSFSLGDTARLLKIRGQAMQKAVPLGIGAMAAIIGLDMEQVAEICRTASTHDQLVVCANDNSPGQIVISGHKDAVTAAMAAATAAGAKRALPLAVSAPFHCSLMQPAAYAMRDAFAAVRVNAPELPVYANVTAGPIDAADDAVRLLVEQVTGQVRWRETILQMAEDGFDTIVEVGAGKVLSGLNKRISDKISCGNLGTPAEIEEFLKTNT